MAKLTLTPDPTFVVKVDIPVPGKGDAPVAFTFIYRTEAERKEWQKNLPPEMADADAILSIASGWDLDDAFTAENIARFCDCYPAGITRVTERYIRELKGVRAKN